MKRFFISAFLIVLCAQSPLFSQRILLNAGFNKGKLFDFGNSDAPYNKEYHSAYGYQFGIQLTDFMVDRKNSFRIGLSIEKYSGDFKTSYGEHFGSETHEGTFSKEVLGIDFFPLNIKLKENFHFSAGIHANWVYAYSVTGTSSTTYFTDSSFHTIYRDLSTQSDFVTKKNIGLRLGLSYTLPIGSFFIQPSYYLHLGFKQEFNSLDAPAKSFRQLFQIGVGYTFKKSKT